MTKNDYRHTGQKRDKDERKGRRREELAYKMFS